LGATLGLAALENLDLGLALGVRLVPKTAGIAACRLGLAAGNEESSRQDPQRRSQRMIPHKDLRKGSRLKRRGARAIALLAPCPSWAVFAAFFCPAEEPIPRPPPLFLPVF